MTLNRKLLVGLGFTALLVVAGTVWAANSGGIEEVAEQPGFGETATETAAVAADAGAADAGVSTVATTTVTTTTTVETSETDTVPASLATETVMSSGTAESTTH